MSVSQFLCRAYSAEVKALEVQEAFPGEGAVQRDLNVRNAAQGVDLLKNVSGFVKKGGITAVLGASASGKSVLLQTLAGRMQDLDISGDVFMDGKSVDPKKLGNPVAYVPQEDSLIGELTAREVTTNTALFKRNDPRSKIDADVDDMMNKLGIGHVADGIIGTLIFRGLSGGQKKRAEIACELIASPSILLLDEPTSGLDSKVALDVLTTIRNLVKQSDGKFSVLLTIHQPNSSILALFDHIMLIEKGSTIFTGSLPSALEYFDRIGFSCPSSVTPTDYFLQISDENFSFKKDFDFKDAYRTSPESTAVNDALSHLKQTSTSTAVSGDTDMSSSKDVSFWFKVYVLVYREYALAYRDPTLYYFQLIMLYSFAFFSGAVFWDLPRKVDGTFNIIPSGLLWIVFCYCWVHAFKVYYLSSGNKRAAHEMSNAKYPVSAVLLADTITTATLAVLFVPVAPIAYFMMGYPARAFPFVLLACWITFLSAEAMIALITKLSKNATTSMVFTQIALVCLQVFGGGVFIAWKDCPAYWRWLQEITVFTHGSRMMNMEVIQYMSFECILNGDQCIEPGTANHYECKSFSSDGKKCEVDGREILDVTQGIGPDEDHWIVFVYLVIIFVCFKIGVALFTYYPPDRLYYKAGVWWTNNVNKSAERGVVSKASVSYDSAPHADSEPAGRVARADSFHADQSGTLSWSDFSVILPKTNAHLVDTVSGYVKSGRILGLMGPSGAGKTTLLNGLAERADYAITKGSVKFGGRTMTSQDLTYVPQFDEVNDVLTVYEHIKLVGHMTCVDAATMLTRAEELLEVLGLVEKRDMQVRFLSGGEIKRLSIGVGLISNPYVLFLDEPTTGLDSTAAYSIVRYLSTVAKATKVAVIMTIHQPSALVFDMLDDLLLLEKGKLVYGGSIEDAAEYFTSIGYSNPDRINPADYYLDLVQDAPPDDTSWTNHFTASSFGKQYFRTLEQIGANATDKMASATPSTLTRLYVMTMHFFGYFLKDPGYFIYRIYALLFIAVFEGTLFLDLDAETGQINAYVGALFSTAVAVMLCAVASTALFARDRREAVDRVANGFYSPGVYVLAQFITSSIYNLIAVAVFCSIFHWLTDLNPNIEAFVFDIAISWGHLMLMEAALMVIIEALKNDFLSTTAGMIFIGSNMLFSGFFRQQSDIPPSISWMCYVVPLHWSFNGFVWITFRDQTFDVAGTSPTAEMEGKVVLDELFGLRDISAWGMFGALMAYVVFFRGCQYFLFALQTGKLHLPFMAPTHIAEVSPEEGTIVPTEDLAPVNGRENGEWRILEIAAADTVV